MSAASIQIAGLIGLAVALVALRKKWAKTYIVTCLIAEFFNVLVLVVQSFMKIPALRALAPKGNEPIVAVMQGVALCLFVVLGWIAVRRGRFVLG